LYPEGFATTGAVANDALVTEFRSTSALGTTIEWKKQKKGVWGGLVLCHAWVASPYNTPRWHKWLSIVIFVSVSPSALISSFATGDFRFTGVTPEIWF
jgi:hypothetical protein